MSEGSTPTNIGHGHCPSLPTVRSLHVAGIDPSTDGPGGHADEGRCFLGGHEEVYRDSVSVVGVRVHNCDLACPCPSEGGIIARVRTAVRRTPAARCPDLYFAV